MVAGSLVDDRLSPETHTWLPTEAEIAGIAEPLARIAARHSPDVAGASGDVVDGLEVGVVTLGYVLRAHTDAKRLAVLEQQAAQNRAAAG